jgi:glutamyl-tRNA synthetase
MPGEVRVRFAPSPTGHLHVGGARTALFNWLYARHHGGAMILRIEDTDRSRSTDENIDFILDALRWLELDWDEGPPTPGYRQTERFDLYRAHAQRLLAEGRAYYCACTPEQLEAERAEAQARNETFRYSGRCRKLGLTSGALRLRIPDEGTTVVEDLIHGSVTFDHRQLDDWILVRSDGTPTYNFCVVVDDSDMQVTHVIRGDDHLNNTPRQMNMLLAMNATLPVYAHVPMILGADGAKLSKRHGAVSVLQYREDGYLPEALLNYLVRLGWSHGDQEIFSIEEMTQFFDIRDVNKSASAFNADKLLWINQQHIMRATPQRLAQYLRPQLEALGIQTDDEARLIAVARAQQERAKTLKEMAQNSGFFFRDVDTYDAKAAQKNLTADARAPLQALRANLQALANWDKEAIHSVVQQQSTDSGLALGKIAQPLRVAVSGTGVSPPIDVTLEVLGKADTLKRLTRAIEWIDATHGAKAG